MLNFRFKSCTKLTKFLSFLQFRLITSSRTMASSILEIDGSMLEGGGQILRNAAALSCLLNAPITVNNVRAGRSTPGLRPQHLTGLQLIKDICSGKLEGGNVGSTKITLHPSIIKAGTHSADTKTAGSICLLIQAALPCLFYANGPTQLNLKGGTNADMAPQIDFLTWVFKPMAEKFGISFECDIERRGYYPKGGGEVTISCSPVKYIKAVDLTEVGHITQITGRAFVAGVLPIKVAHIMSKTAQDMLRREYGKDIPTRIEVVKEAPDRAVGTGTGIIVMAETSTGCRLAGSALGKKGVPAEKVAQNAAEMLINNIYHGGCADDFIQDQLIILMALAKGKSRVLTGALSLHTETAIHVAQLVTKAKFEVKEINKCSHIIECEGIGLENPYL